MKKITLKSVAIGIGKGLVYLIVIFGVFFILVQITAFLNIPTSQNNVSFTKYACWKQYENPINVSNITKSLIDFNETDFQATIQQNFILTSKTNNSVLWYQYAYDINGNDFIEEVWKNNKSISFYDYPQSPSKTPKYIVLNNSLINNNQTIKISFIMIDPNQTFTFYLNIPKNYQLYENKTSGYLQTDFYNTFNFEIDFNKIPKNYIMTEGLWWNSVLINSQTGKTFSASCNGNASPLPNLSFLNSTYIGLKNDSIPNTTNEINMSFIEKVRKMLPNSTIIIQQDFLLPNKSNYYNEYWIQFAFIMNNNTFVRKIWHNNNIINYTILQTSNINNISEIKIFNNIISNKTIKVVFDLINKTTSKNYTFYYNNVSENYNIYNTTYDFHGGRLSFDPYDFYNDYNLEVDWNTMPKNYTILPLYDYYHGVWLINVSNPKAGIGSLQHVIFNDIYKFSN